MPRDQLFSISVEEIKEELLGIGSHCEEAAMHQDVSMDSYLDGLLSQIESKRADMEERNFGWSP